MGGRGAGVGGGGSGQVVLIDNGRVYQSKAADALVQVKASKLGTNVGLNMLVNISSRYFGGLFWSRQLRGLPSSDGCFLCNLLEKRCVIFIISWHCSLIDSFLADTLRYLSWPALSRS